MANIGITLRSARIQRGLTIEQVAQDTRISSRFLEALESEAFDELPAPVYVRGFLRSYGNYLRLDPQPLLEQLEPRFGGGASATPAPATASPAARRPDPFRPAAPLPPPPPPQRPQFIDDTAYDESVAVGADPFSARRIEPETPLDAAYERPYRRASTGGVLMERGAVYNDSGGAARVLAIVGGALIVLVLFAGVAYALARGGGDDDDSPAGGGGINTPGSSGTGTIVVVGTATATRSATVPATAATSPAPTQTPGGPTATPTSEATATPTQAGDTPTPTATKPPATPTATPVPPTPTPTMIPPPPHGSAFSECPQSAGQPQCNWPTTVVCPPGEIWFVDYGNDFPAAAYGWPARVANSNADAITAGQSGCS